jgi:hypothetical protein
MKQTLTLIFVCCIFVSKAQRSFDICVYGGTSAGVIAAYSASKKGMKVVLVEPSNHLGGLSAGGLGQTDIGNKYAITGLSRDFYRRIGQHYNRFEQWTFEPHVAEGIFEQYIKNSTVTVIKQRHIIRATKSGSAIQSITIKDGDAPAEVIAAKVFIDCSYEGDLMAMAGVPYTYGRESNASFNETWNGVQLLDKHQFPDNIDPFVESGKPESGLLWGISAEKLAPRGSGDAKLQAYNFRLCLTDSVANQVPITKPDGYNAANFELLLRYIAAKKPHELNWALMHIQPMPNRKTDINNSGPFSTDMIGENYDYAEASFEDRQAIVEKHEQYIKSFLYFLGHDERVPEHLRSEMLRYGYPKDEYVDNEHFSHQIYVREARRMIGQLVMTQHHCEGTETVEDGVGMAAYTMDSHNCQRIVVTENGQQMVKNEGDVQQGLGGLPPYPIAYRAITPKASACSNIIVPVCLSATHIAYGSIRMEPVFMVLGQSAGVAAAMAIKNNVNVQEVDVKTLQNELITNPLLNNSQPEILIDNDAPTVEAQQGWYLLKTGGKYGKSFLKHDGQGVAAVTYKTIIPKKKTYNIMVYVPKSERLSKEVTMYVNNKKVIITNNLLESDWLNVGSFKFKAKQPIEIKITTENATGAVIADAVLLKAN